MKKDLDYSQIRGFNYSDWQDVSEEKQRREFGYACSLRMNSVRIWLQYGHYCQDPEGYVEKLKRFVRTGHEMGISTMPILFNGNGLNPEQLEKEFSQEGGKRYIRDIVCGLAKEPGLAIWDVMNEPSCNDYIGKAGDDREARWNGLTEFLIDACGTVKAYDTENPITIGHTYIEDVEPTLEYVDLISFHDYFSTRRAVRETYEKVKRISEACQKPFINSELCCLCRANPYDMALDICREYHAGWYLFELMIKGYWADVHGIFYEDGTVRDPSIPAAVLGFSRKRGHGRVLANPNKEGYAQKGIQMVKEALEEETEVFHAKRRPLDEVLEAAEYCANLLEACELVPMNDPPTTQIERIRENGDMAAARRLAYRLACILQKECQIIR